MYQIHAYVTNTDPYRTGTVIGLLLYARTDAPAQPDLDLQIQGSRIAAQTLDLDQPWEQIRDRLEEFRGWLDL